MAKESQQNRLNFDQFDHTGLSESIFKPKPGWGGKLKTRLSWVKKWLPGHVGSRLIPFISFGILILGMYMLFIN